MWAKMWLMKTAFGMCKPIQFQGQQKDITADRENWSQQQSKQD